MNKLNDFWKQAHDTHLRPQYSIKEVAVLPQSYKIWEDTYASNTVNYEKVKEVYAYINSDNTRLWKQALDSSAEYCFMSRTINNIHDFDVNQDLWGKQIQVWTKNQALVSDVFLQYLDEQSLSKKMFVDFIFKVNDNYIYVEVKSASRDYDPDKTKNIAKAFECYTKISNKNVVFSLVKVKTKTNTDSSCEYENYSQIKWIGKCFTIAKIIRILVEKND